MSRKLHRYYVYIVASRTHILYCGFTNDLEKRVAQHKAGAIPGFTQRYNCNRLVWFERYQYVNSAIAREKQIKAWTRERKLSLINEVNPGWTDLSEAWGTPIRVATEADHRSSRSALRAPGQDDRKEKEAETGRAVTEPKHDRG